MRKIIVLFFVPLMFVVAGCSTTTPPAQPVTPESVSGGQTKEADIINDADVVFDITGSNFAFSQTELTVHQGDRVKIVFGSKEGFHDWVIDEFNTATERVQAGATSEVTFVADKAGTFEYYCSVGKHRDMGMVGQLIVEPTA
ncbi:MAG: plastocyanin/azurin family copper-binding protein [Pseudomonadota bacterium]